MGNRKSGLAHNLLISSAILLTALIVTSAHAADNSRKFLPIGQTTQHAVNTTSLNGRQFIPLRDTSRNLTKGTPISLNGGNMNKVWKLKDLNTVPRAPKKPEVPDEIKLAMAQGHVPYAKGDDEHLPMAGADREAIAAALAPVIAEKEKERDALDTDIELPQATASGVTDALPEPLADAVNVLHDFVWPVAGNHFRISSPFGKRVHPVTGKQDFHAGIDIPAPMGTAVMAVADGEVAIGTHPNLGRYVKITHEDGSYSLYGHLQNWLTHTGAHVKAGDRIGKVGMTGRTTGPHLDFSIRKDGKPFNPMNILAGVMEEKKLAFAQ